MTLQTRVVRVQTLVIEVRRGDRSGVAFAVGASSVGNVGNVGNVGDGNVDDDESFVPIVPTPSVFSVRSPSYTSTGRCLARAILSLVTSAGSTQYFVVFRSKRAGGRHRTSLEDARGDSSAAAASAATRISSWASPRRSTRGSNARRRRRRWSSASSRVDAGTGTGVGELGSVPRGRRFGSATSNVQSSRTRAAASTSCSRRSATSAARRATTSSASCRRSRRSTWRASRRGVAVGVAVRDVRARRGRGARRLREDEGGGGVDVLGQVARKESLPGGVSPEASARRARGGARGAGPGSGRGASAGARGTWTRGTRGARREDSTARGSSPRPSEQSGARPTRRGTAREWTPRCRPARARRRPPERRPARRATSRRASGARASGDISDAQDHAPPRRGAKRGEDEGLGFDESEEKPRRHRGRRRREEKPRRNMRGPRRVLVLLPVFPFSNGYTSIVSSRA